MYRPPLNSTNRVKSIKSKFESIENAGQQTTTNKLCKNGTGSDLKDQQISPKQTLARQLSDPCKRNIKRTPAFRLDNKKPIIETKLERSALYENKVKQFSALKTNCDAINTNENVVINKPLLIKSKSSHDFQLIRSRFDARTPLNPTDSQRNTLKLEKNLSTLYTEPIPKALRPKRGVESPIKIDIHNTSTLKITEKDNTLSETLKSALKKPLPSGPAPKKPPRTFQHALTPSKNESFLHLTKDIKEKLNIGEEKPPRKKTDHKYMLNKLETALKNNKLRARRAVQPTTSTSGEDSDDSLLFNNSKAQKNDLNTHFSSFNCLQSLNCTNNHPYGRIKEPTSSTSSFFVNFKEPVYAEPFHFQAAGQQDTKQKQRNSLYYMSSPVKMETDDLVVDRCEKIAEKKMNGEVGNIPKSLSVRT